MLLELARRVIFVEYLLGNLVGLHVPGVRRLVLEATKAET